MADQQRIAAIMALSFTCCPGAVFWGIALIVILTFKSMAIGSLANVSNEVAHIMPSVAYRDASAAVILVGLIGRVIAAIEHIAPGRIERVMYMPVNYRMITDVLKNFTKATPARRRFAVEKICGRENLFYPAVAFTKPSVPMPVVGRHSAQNREAPKTPPCKVIAATC